MPKKIIRGMNEIKKQIAALITAAFAFVSALFWRDAIMEFINTYVPAGTGWPYMMVSAAIVTVIAVVATYAMGRMLAG